MNGLFLLAVRAAALLLVLTAPALTLHGRTALAAAPQRTPASAIHVAIQQGLLTVDVRDVPS